MQQQTDLDNTGFAERAVVRVRAQAPETRLLPMAARRVAGRPEYQQVNRVDRTGAALNGGWTFLVNTATSTVLWTVGDPDHLDFEAAMGRAPGTCRAPSRQPPAIPTPVTQRAASPGWTAVLVM